MIPKCVDIVEVGPRDGLQNEPTHLTTATKIAFIEALAEAGLRQIEVTSFVHPKSVPQLADAAEVLGGLGSLGGRVLVSALVPNERGLDRALQAGVKRIAVFTGASETFTQKNIRMSIDESLATFGAVIDRAKKSGVSIRAYLSTCFDCPYEGAVAREAVLRVTERLLELGADQVAISDTIGSAAPNDITETVGYVIDRVPVEKIALHLHDTNGTALANVLAGLQLGVATFDSSAGGLGGCPYAPGAAGNLATEDLVYMLNRMGISTGVDLTKLLQAVGAMAELVKRPIVSRQWLRCAGFGGACA